MGSGLWAGWAELGPRLSPLSVTPELGNLSRVPKGTFVFFFLF